MGRVLRVLRVPSLVLQATLSAVKVNYQKTRGEAADLRALFRGEKNSSEEVSRDQTSGTTKRPKLQEQHEAHSKMKTAGKKKDIPRK